MEDKGMILTLLRLGEYPAALRRLAQRRIAATDSLLRAFGVDPEEFRIGAWLNKQDVPDELCKTGGERSARMLMDWVDLRWDVELKRRKVATATHCYKSYPEPYFPQTNLTQLLRPDNGVTEETKARIAKFIETRGLEMFPLKSWLYGYPKGAEKWLVPVARIGLTDELNAIRKRSSQLLTVAGIAHAEPEMRPAPRFRVTIDGNPWPGKYGSPARNRPCAPPMELATKEAQFSAYLTPVGTDLYEADPDKFRENGPPIKASIDMTPREYDGKPIDPASLWLHADVPLPISFDKVNEIHIKSQKFWIAPRFSRPAAADEDDGYEVEFHRAQGTKDEPVPREGHCRLFVKGRDPLALSNVSPGEYWLRIYHPGSVLSEWKKVTVSWWLNTVRLRLDVGSCLVVPVDWPEMESPEELPPELAREFVWSSSSANEKLRSVIRLKREDGSIVNGFGRMPVTAKDRFPNAVVFPYLPPGEYEVESPDRTIEPKGTSPGSVIRRSSLKVSIREDSPVFVITGPLKVHYSRKD